MTILYNCHTDGDEYRITKFSDGEVESSYLCSTDECQCPAGSQPTCRHRQMLPMFLNRGAVDTFWFLDWDRKGWVSNEPAELLETRLATKPILDEPKPKSDLQRWSDIISGKFKKDLEAERSELSSLNDEPTPLKTLETQAASDWEYITRTADPDFGKVFRPIPTKPSWRRI